MTAARLSSRTFVADIVFLDGSKRTVDYDGCSFTTTSVMFDTGEGTCTWLNLAAMQSMETMKAAQPLGETQ